MTMDGKHFYTDERNAQIVVALLKAHGIKRVIANPGTTNIAIVGSMQNDPWFEVYSGIDERHSAYMAVGMAVETGEPVVLSCTGATASRNYLPALTEAYYRKLPILAITSLKNFDQVGQLAPQAIDRTTVQKDVVRRSFECRVVENDAEASVCQRKVNEAILELKRAGGGPVHINLEISWRMTFNTKVLPPVKKIERYDSDSLRFAPSVHNTTKIALFVGAGKISTEWEQFAKVYNVAVICDETSEYYGEKKIHSALVCSQTNIRNNPKFNTLKPDLIIEVGEVSGDYPTCGFLNGSAPVWRVSDDGEVKSLFGMPECVFEMSHDRFIQHYVLKASNAVSSYYNAWKVADEEVRGQIPDLPFSNPWLARHLSRKIPSGAEVHLGILNSLRSWNCFPAKNGVKTFSNVGGFGIDGDMSTLIGASLVDRKKLFFGVIGDLAFFYDLNSLGNRYIGDNLRILLINNGCGGEFNIYNHPGSQFGLQTNDYIAAGGHFGRKSSELVKHYVTDLGFKYIAAHTKEEFLEGCELFLSPDRGQSVVFECFTEVADESAAHEILNNIETYTAPKSMTEVVKGVVPKRVKNIVKVAIGR